MIDLKNLNARSLVAEASNVVNLGALSLQDTAVGSGPKSYADSILGNDLTISSKSLIELVTSADAEGVQTRRRRQCTF